MIRNNCCICNGLLHNIKNFNNYPIQFCMSEVNSYEYSSLNFSLCEQCNTIQLATLIELKKLYNIPHNDNIIGKTWSDHFIFFSNFINDNCKIFKNVLEIGGASDKLLKNFDNYDEWILLDPNSKTYNSNKISNITKFFDKDFIINKEIKTIINSHLIEHLYNPCESIKTMYNILDDEGELFISVPNMESYALSNAPFLGIHFEHTYFLNEANLLYIFNLNNFKVINKQYFKNHSIFYHLKKYNFNLLYNIDFIKQYNISFLELFNKNLEYYNKLVIKINSAIENKKNIFLFGCHTNTQFLIYFNLNIKNIKCILDNDNSKHNKYFYGSSLLCKAPKIIENIEKPIVICYIGIYSDEVKSQLKDINNDVIFI